MQRGSGQCDDTQSISLGEWMTYVAQVFEKRTGIENSIFKAFKILDKEDCGALPYSEAGTFIRLVII
jgi:Ca2+-binding EF-hand superfamily protein